MTNLAFAKNDHHDLQELEGDQHPRAAASVPVDAHDPSVAGDGDEDGDVMQEGAELRPSMIARVPRITIAAFHGSPDVARAVEIATADRLMARTQTVQRDGGIAAATEHYRESTTPNLLIVESSASGLALLREVDRLAEVCTTGTKVLIVGRRNDIGLYRELIKRGVSEYLVTPLDPMALITTVSGIFSDKSAEKLGRVYAFVGARGGVGSSTIAHNVGWTMAREFQTDVLLADMDLPFGTGGLNFNQDAGQGIAEAIKDAGRLDEMLLDKLLVKCGDNVSLLSAPASLDRPYDLDESVFEPLLEVAQRSFPFTILDIPHLWTSWARKALVSVDDVIITVSPDLANLRNAKSMVAFLRQARPNDPPPKIVLNQVGVPKRSEIKPKEFAETLNVQPLASIAFEPALFSKAENNGQMIAQVSAKAGVNHTFSEIARAISGRKEIKSGRRGLFDLGSLLKR